MPVPKLSEIKKIIADGKLEKALNAFKDWVELHQPAMANDVYQLLKRLNEEERKNLKSLITEEEFRVQSNKISATFLAYISHCEISKKKDDKAFKHALGDYHRFTCDRVDQSDRFILKREENRDKKIQFYYLLGDPRQSHKGLFMRFAYDFEGRLQDYLNPELAAACKVIKKDELTFQTSRIPEIYKTNILKSLYGVFSITINERDGILDKNIANLYENSPELKGLTATDYVLVLLTIDQWDWEPDITPEVTRWFITRFCNAKLPENSPSFFFFFGVGFDQDFPEIEDEIKEIVEKSSYLTALPKLDMVRYRDIASWFARYRIVAEESEERREMIKIHFGEDRRKEHFMENVEMTLKRIIDEYNEGE